jgi:hypothetical protein
MSDWEASTIVMIELPSLDNFPPVLIYIYVRAARAHPPCSQVSMLWRSYADGIQSFTNENCADFRRG